MNVLSVDTCSSGDFVKPHGFKCHTYATSTQVYISRLYLLPELRTQMSTCLLGIFFVTYTRHLKLIISNTEALTFPSKTAPLRLPHVTEWQFILLVLCNTKCAVILDDSLSPSHKQILLALPAKQIQIVLTSYYLHRPYPCSCQYQNSLSDCVKIQVSLYPTSNQNLPKASPSTQSKSQSPVEVMERVPILSHPSLPPHIANPFYRLLLFILVLTLFWSHWFLAVSPSNAPGRVPYHMHLPHPGTFFSQILMWLAPCLQINAQMSLSQWGLL